MEKAARAILVSLLIYFVSYLALAYFMEKCIPPFPQKSNLALLIRDILFVLFIVVFYTRSFRKVPAFLGFARNWFRPIIFGILLTIPFAIVFFIGISLSHMPVTFSAAGALTGLIGVVLGPGFYEEGLFRGLLFKELAGQLKWWMAGLISGLFYGPAHLAGLLFGGTIAEAITKIFYGVLAAFVFGYIFYRLKWNIWLCFSHHFMLDLYAVAFLSIQDIRTNMDKMVPISTMGLLLSWTISVYLMSRERMVKFLIEAGPERIVE